MKTHKGGYMKNISVWGVISYILIGIGTIALFFLGKDAKNVTDFIGLVSIAFACVGDLIKWVINNVKNKNTETA